MAVDPKHGDGTSGSAEAKPESDTARTRKFAAAESADSSLDAFIARANAELSEVDVTAFKPEHREEQLRREMDALRTRVVAAEGRAAAAEMRGAAEPRAAAGSRRWGPVIVAFVIGGAAMFAVNLIMPRNERPAAPSVTAPTTVAPTTAAPIATQRTSPMVTPIETYGAVPVATNPVATQAPVVTPPPVAAPIAETVTKKRAGKRAPRRPHGSEDPASAPKPPEDDLYNPF